MSDEKFHQLVTEALALERSTCEWDEFRNRWEPLFTEAGLDWITNSLVDWASRMDLDNPAQHHRLKEITRHLMFVFGVSLLQQTGKP